MDLLSHIPVVSGLAYVERLRQRPSSFEVTLEPESDNRYLPHAIAVLSNGEKVGYLAPEIAREFGDRLGAAGERPVSCAARKSAPSDHETGGVELLLDFRQLGLQE
jgi:hypothetical protein